MLEPQLAVYVPVSAMFPGVEEDLASLQALLHGLSRTDTLVWCARLNLALSNLALTPFERQAFCMRHFLDEEAVTRAFAYAHGEGAKAHQPVVFLRGQLLELMRWAAVYCRDLPGDGDGGTFNDPEARREFSQAALICSGILNTGVWGPGSVEATASSLLCGTAPDLGRKAAEAVAAIDLLTCLGRGWTLFRDYLPSHRPSFATEFEHSTGLSIEEYFACLSMVLSDSGRPAQNAGFRYGTVLQHTPYDNVFQRYMTLQSQTPDELRDSLCAGFPEDLVLMEGVGAYDKRPLRDKPILRTRRGLAVILDPLFFGDSAVAGLLFHVVRASPGSARDLFAAFGRGFEQYVNDILRRMFPGSATLAALLLTNETIVEYRETKLEADACIVEPERAALFETKALWMREETVLTDDHGDYMAYLHDKYVTTGLAQLARMISALADPRQLAANSQFDRARLIYPVMVVNDRFLSVPYVGRFFQPEFQRLLMPDEVLQSKRMRKGRLVVTPPVVIDIEVLEGLESLTRHYGLLDLFDDYSRECSDGAVSLEGFLALSPKYAEHFNRRRSAATKAIEALRAASREIFPGADLTDL